MHPKCCDNKNCANKESVSPIEIYKNAVNAHLTSLNCVDQQSDAIKHASDELNAARRRFDDLIADMRPLEDDVIDKLAKVSVAITAL